MQSAGEKRAAALKAKDPDFFKKIGAKGAAKRKTKYLHFKELADNDPDQLREIGSKGGKAKK